MADRRKANDVKPPMRISSSKSRAEIVGECLSRYALTLREASGNPVVITMATVDAYMWLLEGCATVNLERAMRIAGETARFFPRPEQIRSAYERIVEGEASQRKPTCELCEGAGYVIKAGRIELCGRCGLQPGGAGKERKA